MGDGVGEVMESQVRQDFMGYTERTKESLKVWG